MKKYQEYWERFKAWRRGEEWTGTTLRGRAFVRKEDRNPVAVRKVTLAGTIQPRRVWVDAEKKWYDWKDYLEAKGT